MFKFLLVALHSNCIRGKLGALILVLQNNLIVPFSSPTLSRSDKGTVPHRCFSFSTVLAGLILVAACYKPHFLLAVSRLVALKHFRFVDL